MSKSSKWRACPALGRDITSADCGAQRQSRLACPASCPHNPFSPANYSQLLETENRLDSLIMEQLPALAPDPAAMERSRNQAGRRSIQSENAFFIWNFFLSKNADGLTVAQRWEKSGVTELKNDERVLLRGKMQTQVSLLEIHRVLSNNQVEAVDLLSAGQSPMIFQDRSLAGMAARFSTLLSWVYPLPHYWRMSGTALVITDVAHFTAPEIVREIVQHLGGPAGEPELRRWLAEHYIRFSDSLTAVQTLRHRQMLAQIDAKYGKVVYELRAPFAQCRQQLDDVPELDVDELSGPELDEGFAEARVWFDGPPKSKQLTVPGGQMVMGRVLLGQSHWRLEAFGTEKLSRLRRLFEETLRDLVRFQGERIDDLGGQLNAKTPIADEALAPPRLLEKASQFTIGSSRVPIPPAGVSREEAEEEMRRQSDLAFLDECVPALENHTPREAARDLLLRPLLVQLMKQRVRSHDEHKLQTGSPPSAPAEDVNWMLRELELKELIFDPPPWRPPPPEPHFGDEGMDPELDEIYEPPPPEPNRAPAPPLPAKPLKIEEAARRLQAAVDSFKTAKEARDELYASGATIMDDVDELTRDTLDDVGFSFAVPFILQTWFALAPPGYRAPEVQFGDLEKAFHAHLQKFEDCVAASTPKKLENFFLDSPQPDLMLVLFDTIIQAAGTADKAIRPGAGALPVILTLLKAIVEQLDRALRRKS